MGTAGQMNEFNRETAELVRRRTRVLALLGGALYCPYWFMDRLLNPEMAMWSLQVRAIAMVFFVLAYFSTYLKTEKVWFRNLSAISLPLASAVSVSVIVTRLEGFSSNYYFGILVTVFAATIFPWNHWMSAVLSAVTTCSYVLIVGASSNKHVLADAVQSIGFIQTTGVFSFAASYTQYSSRRNEFDARMRLEEANKQTALARERAERAREDQERFFANVTHELRTPLTLILTSCEAALGNETGSETTRDLKVARRNALRLLRTVNQMLDLSKLGARAMTLEPRAVDLTQLVDSLCREFKPLADERDVSLSAQSDSALDVVVIDDRHLESILVNLIGNALKFTSAGGSVMVSVVEHGPEIQVSVRDDGPGISETDQARIFSRFQQASADERVGGGTGLGLALVNELVQLLGGTLALETAAGNGSTFRITLPIEREPEPRPRLPNAQVLPLVAKYSREAAIASPTGVTQGTLRVGPTKNLVGASILIAEDNPEMRRAYVEHLAPYFHVTAVSNGLEALSCLSDETYDLLCTDLSMPELDGVELVRRVRASTAFRDLPIIMFTAHGELDARIRGRELGVDSYLTKPTPLSELLANVRGLLRARMKLIDHYLVYERLGVGGQGDVYFGQDCSTGQEVALKLLNTDYLADRVVAKGFRQEFERLASIDHPNVVKVHSVGENEAHLYLVMEYLRGLTLETLLQDDGGLSFQHVAILATRMGDALSAVHSAGAVHRDVKPSNIMVLENSVPLMKRFRLIDFGIAATGSGESRLEGTPGYLAPELFLGEPASAASDVFAFGVTLYQAFSGRLPYADRNPETLSAAAEVGAIETGALNETPERFSAPLRAALSYEPQNRPSAAELRNALSTLQANDFPAISPATLALHMFQSTATVQPSALRANAAD